MSPRTYWEHVHFETVRRLCPADWNFELNLGGTPELHDRLKTIGSPAARAARAFFVRRYKRCRERLRAAGLLTEGGEERAG